MLKTRRAYIRAIKGLSVERQRQMATDAGCGEIYGGGAHGNSDADERRLWVLSFRAGDTAWVPDMRVLIFPPEMLGKVRVTADLAGCLAEICSKGAVVEEGRTGDRSDGEGWPNKLKSLIQTIHLVNRSRLKVLAGAKTARAAKAKRASSGIVAEWAAPAKAKALKQALVLWQSRSFKNWKDARAALPGELATASLATLTRIFHPHGRDPSRKGVGGRSRK